MHELVRRCAYFFVALLDILARAFLFGLNIADIKKTDTLAHTAWMRESEGSFDRVIAKTHFHK